ncbi:MAG: helix-turn-helix transcriptional regulator [Wolinella sp.]
MSDENIVKRACRELGITQKELAERMGVAKPTIERWAQSGEIPESGIKSLAFLMEIEELRAENSEIKQAIQALLKYASH